MNPTRTISLLDVKLGARMLLKNPGLNLVGGLGIAVAVAIAAGGFSVIYGNFLASSLPIPGGDRLVSIEIWDSAAGKLEARLSRDFAVWSEDLKSVQELSAFRTLTPNLIASGAQPGTVRVASMSASGFRAAGVRPLMGRAIEDADQREGAPAVVVIGESVWRNRFAADPSILGRTIRLGSTPHSVIGVMPEGFAFPVNHQFWIPLRAGVAVPPLTGPELTVFGRLAPGATLESAQAELDAVARRAAADFPSFYARLQPRVLPYPYPFLGMHQADDVAELHTMQGIVTLLLVLVCLNVAILVYTRTATRQAEITIRSALGAARGRIVAQLFVEALVLSSVAAIVGIGIASVALRLVKAATLPIAQELPFWLSFQLSPGAVLYAVGLAVLSAAIVGILPALEATRMELQTGLRAIGAGGGARLGKTWTALIVAQVAFTVALLPGAVSHAADSYRQGIAGLGFPAEHYATAQVGADAAPASLRELTRRLEADPRVSSLAIAMANPGEEPGATFDTQTTVGHSARYNRVDLEFFRAFGVPLLAGRGFSSEDVASGGAVVVNRSFADRVFDGNALGRRIRYTGRNDRWHEIVGIVADFPTGASPEMGGPQLRVYHPAAHEQIHPATLLLRIRGAAASTFAAGLPAAAAAVDPDLQLHKVSALDDALRREQWIRRLEASVLIAVTLCVVALSSAGIYALMSITVSQRRKEIGIRTALGSDPKRIVASIFSRALGQLAVGAAIGMLTAAALHQASDGNLIVGNAAVILPSVALFLMAVGFLAALAPARRSLRIDPVEELRQP